MVASGFTKNAIKQILSNRNPEFMKLAREQGIEVVYACSLEMLNSEKY
jgi:hypothetical protein